MMRRPPVLGACVLILAALGGAGPAQAAGRGQRLILAPRAHTVAGPVTVVLRVGHGYMPRALQVTLNGRDISSYFHTVRHGRRTTQVSPSQGLRFGRNVLTVVLDPGDRPTERQSIRFSVSRALPLAAAGPDRRVAVGSPAALDGSATLPRAFGRSTPLSLHLRLHWRLVARPRGSHARLFGETRTITSLLGLRQPGGVAHPGLRPDRLGLYRVALRVDDGRRSSVDTVTEQATPNTAEVPIDTAVNGTTAGGVHRQGIAIGYHPAQLGYRGPRGAEQFYPLPSGDAAQVVVVDRGTLAPIFHAAYPASAHFPATLYTLLHGTYTRPNDLVIVTTWPSSGWQPDGLAPGTTAYLLTTPSVFGPGPLRLIGAAPISLKDANNARPMEHSALSWIGVPGFPAGADWERIGGGNYGGSPAGLDGFVVADHAGNYTYVAKAGVPFDLGADSGTTATMTVGRATYRASLPAGSMGGFAVMVLHAGTLAPYNLAEPSAPGSSAPVVFSTRNADGSANYGGAGSGGMNGMSAFLEQLQYDQIGEPVVILIRSIGAPMPLQGRQPENNYQGTYDVTLALAVDRLAFDVASLGGTYQWIIRLATPASNAKQSYSEIGRNHTAEGDTAVAENSSAISPALTSTELSGRLERGNRSRFAPAHLVDGPALPDPLTPAVTSEPVPWPLTTTAAQRLGVQCVGEAVNLGRDPRSEYFNLQTGPTDWGSSGYGGAVRSLTRAEAQVKPGCSTLSAPAFTAAQRELGLEFKWMEKLQSYVADLTKPQRSNETQPVFSDIATATQAVLGSLPMPSVAHVNGFSIFGSFLNIAADLLGPEAEIISASVNVVGDSFSLWSNFAGDESNTVATVFAQRDVIAAAGDKLAAEVAKRLRDVAEGSQTMTDAIASDYGRLRNVGEHENCVPAVPPPGIDPHCPAGWEVSQKASNTTADAFLLGARRAAWEGLLPTAWPYVLYTNSNPSPNSYNGTFVGPQEQISGIGCDFSQPFNVVSPQFLRYDFRSDPASSEGSNTKFMVLTNGNFRGASSRFEFPSASLFSTNSLFSPVSPGHPDSGPLGLDEYRMFVQDWPYYAQKGPTRVNWTGC